MGLFDAIKQAFSNNWEGGGVTVTRKDHSEDYDVDLETLLTAVAAGDSIVVWDVSAEEFKRITITNFLGAIPAAQHLVLPLHNDTETPTLAFGDGDTGFFESADDTIRVVIEGVNKGVFNASGYTAGGLQEGIAAIIGSAPASNIVPGHTFNSDTDTGIGRATADQLSLIAGAIEGLRISEANGVANMNIVCYEGEIVCNNNEVVTY